MRNRGFAPVVIVVIVAIVALGAGAAWHQRPEGSEKSTERTPSSSQSVSPKQQAKTEQRLPVQPPAVTAKGCPEKIIFDLPIDISKASSVLYPGQIRGGDYKAHGGFRFDGHRNDEIVVRAPIDARLIAGARYPVGAAGEIQYAFDFENDCKVRYRFMHLLTLTPKFQAVADKFPLPQTADSRTTSLEKPIEVKKGEIVATAVGVTTGGPSQLGGINNFMDWGVYDYRKLNEASEDPAWRAAHPYETYQYAVCWFDWISASDRAKVLALPPGDGQSGSASDYCK